MKRRNMFHALRDAVAQPLARFFSTVKASIVAEKIFFSFFILSIFAVIGTILFTTFNRGGLAYLNLEDFAIGKVAERDVAASRDVSYTDQAATEIRRAARLQAIAPIFKQDTQLVSDTLKKYDDFVAFILGLAQNDDKAAFETQVQEQYPGVFTSQLLRQLAHSDALDTIMSNAQAVVKQTLAVGVAEFPEKGIEGLNQHEITLLVQHSNNREYINVQISSIIRKENLESYITHAAEAFAGSLDSDAMNALINPFLQPTLIYDEKETEARVQEILKQVPPVIVTIQKNQKIIKRGFIITAENYEQLQAYANAGNYLDVGKFLGLAAFILCLYVIGIFIFSGQAVSITLKESQKIFLLLISLAVYLAVLFIARSSFFVRPLDILPFIPAALTAMLVATLISAKTAIRMEFLIMLIVLTASGFKLEPALFTLFSGFAAVALLKLTGRRMDLIKTACQLAFIHPVITLVLFSVFPNSYSDFIFVLFGSVVNGFISGIFVLGFLPILEDRMNTPTCFRLMELSDLNSPTMKQLLLTASGTYNHTMMVATLAEAACREIGADALLARVGAYYHDIGKMANTEYFVENQTSYNKHLDLNPRLSAAIIRSHVKIGVEQAERLRLPREVIDIIGQHHGNSLVQYFYAKAKALDPNVSPADFSYPGQPPRTKEAAVVMLADVSEAACRTLDHPSVSRLEKFIGGLVKGKMEAGQLDNCDLTLRELHIIQESFVTTLAGYYHSRIKYPNQKDPDEKKAEQKPADAKAAEREAAPDKGSEDKAGDERHKTQCIPALKGISPEVKKYLQIDLGLAAPEQPPVFDTAAASRSETAQGVSSGQPAAAGEAQPASETASASMAASVPPQDAMPAVSQQTGKEEK